LGEAKLELLDATSAQHVKSKASSDDKERDTDGEEDGSGIVFWWGSRKGIRRSA
jgi:hypothetical protein